MASLAEIRAKLAEQQNRSSGNSTGGGDNAIYPHWNMQEGKEAVVRFLPDGNTDNTFFWVERAMIKLPFAGIKGETDSRNTIVQVPCVEMYNDGGGRAISALNGHEMDSRACRVNEAETKERRPKQY